MRLKQLSVQVQYERKASSIHIFHRVLGKRHRDGTAKLALEAALGWQTIKVTKYMHEGQRPPEHSTFRLVREARPLFGQSARREGPGDGAVQAGRDQVTVSLGCIVQFKRERDVIRWHC